MQPHPVTRVAARQQNTGEHEHVNPTKKLALVGPMYPYRGGIAHFLETMHSGLEARGHAVHSLTFTRQYPGFLFPGKTQLDQDPRSTQPIAHRVVDSIDPRSWFKAARIIAQLGSDAAIFKYWMPFLAPAFGTIARSLARRGIKIVAVVDNAIPHERHLGDAALGRYALGAVDGCVFMSESVGSDLKALGVEVSQRYVAHPVYDIFGETVDTLAARTTLDLPHDVPVLLFFGFIRRYKGLHVLLEAMPRIVQSVPNVRLVVAGECYDDEKSYRDMMVHHGMERHVRFDATYIPNAEVPVYFSAADVVVQPYISATQSGVAQVAFNFDTPLITTDVGGLAEVIRHEHDGLVVPPEDPEALAEAVIRFFKEGLHDQLREGVRQRKRAFGWDALYEAIESLL